MHPEIIRDKKGTCPICGMDLVKKAVHAKELTGIKLDELLQPTDRFIVSSIALTALIRQRVQPEMDALGTITYDTRQINIISAQVSGRIEKMYVQYRYQHVMKGEHIMDIYSPDIATAEQDLLFLLKNDPDNTSLINASKQKLLLLGMSEIQIAQIINTQKPTNTIAVYSKYSGHLHEAANAMPEGNTNIQATGIMTNELNIKPGMYVERGQNIFQLFNTDRSWVLLNIFPENQGQVKQGTPVIIIPESDPSRTFDARIDFVEPMYREGNRTITARVYFDNSKMKLPIGSPVRAKINVQEMLAYWLPKESVLSTGLGRIVFEKKEGGFIARHVETGMVFGDRIQIISGLNTTDSVAANAQFLADSEDFIKINN
jgi:Cu(I)/Ag(I) efflux system membrane fusion protein